MKGLVVFEYNADGPVEVKKMSEHPETTGSEESNE